MPTTEARVGAGDLDPSQRGRGDTAFPRTRALWVSCAGSSMRNLWRASVFRKRSPPVVASNSHEGCRDPVLRALPQARPGGVLVSANDTPLDSPPRGETGSRVPPILLRFELGHHRLEDRSKGWMVSRLLLQSMALLPALVCRGFQCDERFWSPRSPSPFFTTVFDLDRRSAANDRLTLTCFEVIV